MDRDWKKTLEEMLAIANEGATNSAFCFELRTKPYLHGKIDVVLKKTQMHQVFLYTSKCKSEEEVCRRLVEKFVEICGYDSPEQLMLVSIISDRVRCSSGK